MILCVSACGNINRYMLVGQGPIAQLVFSFRMMCKRKSATPSPTAIDYIVKILDSVSVWSVARITFLFGFAF